MMPPLTRENLQVFEVWSFCEGWNPGLIDVAAAFYGITDLDFLIDQLLLMRDTIGKWRQARAEATRGTRT